MSWRRVLSINSRGILTPKFDLRCVCALGENDTNGVMLAFVVVVVSKLLAKARRLYAYEGIDGRVECLRSPEYLQGEVVAR